MEVWAISILSLVHDYKRDYDCPGNLKEEAVAGNSQKPTSERRPLFIIEFL